MKSQIVAFSKIRYRNMNIKNTEANSAFALLEQTPYQKE